MMRCGSGFTAFCLFLLFSSFSFVSCLEYSLPIDEPEGWNYSSEGEEVLPASALSYFPENNSASAYADTYLVIGFDNTPVINSDGKILIYKKAASEGEEDTLVDTINAVSEKLYMYGNGGNNTLGDVNVQNQLIQVKDKSVYIKPHFNTSTGYSILENSASYYVLTENLFSNAEDITESDGWCFTTAAAPSIASGTITVGSGKDFLTIQGAFNYLMENSSTGSWTIEIDEGDYNERIAYRGSANVTLVGKTSTSYGSGVNVYWCNQNGGGGSSSADDNDKATWNNGSRGRVSFYWCGKNLTLKNIYFTNTATRTTSTKEKNIGTVKYTAKGYNQAETLFFDSSSVLVAFNCGFASKQDTLNLGNGGGKCWFYKCYVEGDVDFIWGGADVALFEECEIKQLLKEKDSYLFETRVGSTSSSTVGKGFVLFNCSVSAGSGSGSAYISRLASSNAKDSPSKTTYDQVAVIDSAFSHTLSSAVWLVTDAKYPSFIAKDSDGNINVGWKTYGNTGFTNIDAEYTSEITDDLYSMEYNGRYTILNRVYNTSKANYEFISSLVDISSLETEFGASSDASLSNDYPVLKTITWDFTSYADKDINIQGTTSGTVEASVNVDDGTSYSLQIVSAGGKFVTSSSRVQMNANTTVYIPYVEGTELTIQFHNSTYASISTVGGLTPDAAVYTVSMSSLTKSTAEGYTDYVEFTSSGTVYVYSIKITELDE